jgi:hypothetical protein
MKPRNVKQRAMPVSDRRLLVESVSARTAQWRASYVVTIGGVRANSGAGGPPKEGD